MVNMFKAHILSFIEYKTPAIFHAAQSVLTQLDMVQTRFLRDVGIGTEDALLHFSLAPLMSRRHIALLAVIHRAALGRAPPATEVLLPTSRAATVHATRRALAGAAVPS